MAVEHAYARHLDYELVWCANGEQPASLLADLASLAAQLGLAADTAQEAQVAALRSWLERHQRWLLVLDNVEDPQQVAELLPRSPSGQVIVTSRTGTGWEPLASVLPVEVLAPADAARLLLARTGETGAAAEAVAATLAATLGWLPLALEQAGAYVAATGTVTLAHYAMLFATRALELLKRGQPLRYQHTVATTWSLALQRLREAEPAAVDLLTLASFLAPDDLPLPLLAAHATELPEPLAGTAADPLTLADAVAALRRFSLVRVVADGLYVHRLLQTVVRADLDIDAEWTWATAALRLLYAGFPEWGEVANWPQCERLLPHALAAADHGQRLEAEPEQWLWLKAESGSYLWHKGQYRQALGLEEQALAGFRRVLGDDHPETLTSMNNLATSRYVLGDLDGARDLHEQALAGRRRVLGDDHPDTLTSMSNLAAILADLGDLDGARDLHEQALAGRRRVLRDDHPDTLTSMSNLAAILADLGDLDGARELGEQALAGFRRVLGGDHPHTLTSMSNLATTLADLGQLDGARELHEQVLAARRRVLGDDHPETLTSMNNLEAVRREIEALSS
jgi:tetratricopeptide (TPR) repeat protein